MSYKIKELPEKERPREKLKKRGIQSLSDAELLAILFQTGTKEKSVLEMSMDLLKKYGSLENLENQSMQELAKEYGIGEIKAMKLVTTFEIGKRIRSILHQSSVRIHHAEDVYHAFHELVRNLTQEHFITVFLNTKNEIISYKTIFIGSANRSIVHPRDIFKEAIRSSAVKILVIHNHPSGDVTPSEEDRQFTLRLIEAGKLLQIPLLDHIIIGKNTYYSFLENQDIN